jgi:hypothetical protein
MSGTSVRARGEDHRVRIAERHGKVAGRHSHQITYLHADAASLERRLLIRSANQPVNRVSACPQPVSQQAADASRNSDDEQFHYEYLADD